MRIAVIGLGRMGRAMAARLLEGGHDLQVWNRSPGKAGELVEAGATEATSVAGAADGAEVVVTLLSNDEAVRAVALEDGGVVASLGPDAVYVDSSTVSPTLSSELAAATGGARFVALPVLGAPSAVRSGQATYLAGGPDATVDRLRPMLDALTENVRRYPEPSLATTAKLTGNLILLSGIVALAEAFAVGRAGGLSDDDLRGLLSESPLVAPGLRNRFEGVLRGEHEAWWTTELGAKDARLAVALAREAGLDVPVAETVQQRYEEASGLDAGGYADGADISVVGRLYRRD